MMMSTNSARFGQTVFSENVNVHFVGEDNTSTRIHGVSDSSITASCSDVELKNSESIILKADQSTVAVSTSKRIKLSGRRNEFDGSETKDALLEGNNNTIRTQATLNLVWSGGDGDCHVKDEVGLQVFGMQNKIKNTQNNDVLVVGHGNDITALKNDNLKVRGFENHVIAIKTRNLTVDGNKNQCFVSNINVPHSLIRIPCGFINDVIFEGHRVPVVNMRNERSAEPRKANGKYVYGYYCKGYGKYYPEKNMIGRCYDEMTAYKNVTYKGILTGIKIQYVNQACIKQNQYHLGIFHFELHGLSFGEKRKDCTRLKLTVNLDILEEAMVASCCVGRGDTLLIQRKVNRRSQALRIHADRIMYDTSIKTPTEFEIYVF